MAHKIDNWKTQPLLEQSSILTSLFQQMNHLQRERVLQSLLKICPDLVQDCDHLPQTGHCFVPPCSHPPQPRRHLVAKDTDTDELGQYSRALSFLRDMRSQLDGEDPPALHFCSQTTPVNLMDYIRSSRLKGCSLAYTVERGEALHRLRTHPFLNFPTPADFFRFVQQHKLGTKQTVSFELDLYELVCLQKLERLLLLPRGNHTRLLRMIKPLKLIFKRDTYASDWRLESETGD